MKKDRIDKRYPLKEKLSLGCIEVGTCFICGLGRVHEADEVSGVKWTFRGFKYVNGIQHMLVNEDTSEKVMIYADEELNMQQCLCEAHPFIQQPPIGTLLDVNKAFAELNTIVRVAPSFYPTFFEYSPYTIDKDKIIRGIDTRTTCMIKNIPNKLTTRQLVTLLASISYNSFDFVYLRMDFKSKCNNGYAFINFRECRYIPLFLDAIKGKKWKNFNSEKKGDITYARIQGLVMLQHRFKRSDILGACKEFWPVIFNEQGEETLASDWSKGKLQIDA
ncbi:hypothetical protein NEDG_01003 [Nematocida displodere]|uniref:Mei2-like C-terminal RNA recognition motif domain-containing protein n=1 Tax=Nematocida displodere TaxID=1805483 RepID=A0A177EA98_9MICR|nr:hypothetical protein NEDG_01003 [Nematocida displodere]